MSRLIALRDLIVVEAPRWFLLMFAQYAIAVGCANVLAPEEPFGPATFSRIAKGMTRAEVQSAVGIAPGGYGPRNPTGYRGTDATGYYVKGWSVGTRQAFERRADNYDEWYGDRYFLLVRYDAEGRVIACDYGRPLYPKSWSLHRPMSVVLFESFCVFHSHGDDE